MLGRFGVLLQIFMFCNPEVETFASFANVPHPTTASPFINDTIRVKIFVFEGEKASNFGSGPNNEDFGITTNKLSELVYEGSS